MTTEFAAFMKMWSLILFILQYLLFLSLLLLFVPISYHVDLLSRTIIKGAWTFSIRTAPYIFVRLEVQIEASAPIFTTEHPVKIRTTLLCFIGMSNFVNKLIIGRVMTLFEVEQLYVVITTLLIGSVAATLATLCTQFYQFVLVAILYGGTSREFCLKRLWNGLIYLACVCGTWYTPIQTPFGYRLKKARLPVSLV